MGSQQISYELNVPIRPRSSSSTRPFVSGLNGGPFNTHNKKKKRSVYWPPVRKFSQKRLRERDDGRSPLPPLFPVSGDDTLTVLAISCSWSSPVPLNEPEESILSYQIPCDRLSSRTVLVLHLLLRPQSPTYSGCTYLITRSGIRLMPQRPRGSGYLNLNGTVEKYKYSSSSLF